MTWIKVERPGPDNPELARALQKAKALYPPEYGSHPDDERLPAAVRDESIVLSHSLIPGALEHIFSAFGVLMSPDLPLKRRDHELIAATVSALNRCFY